VVGKIDKLGSKVIGWEVGQRVGVGWYGGPCLKCDSCKRGDLSNCESFLTTGISSDGGYAEYMTAPMQGLAVIPDTLSSVDAAPLLCAGRTTFTALRNKRRAGRRSGCGTGSGRSRPSGCPVCQKIWLPHRGNLTRQG
jgi:D-arabinose 1-dehydrogenase-like Zn-dependent alcohol dehydrogenase